MLELLLATATLESRVRAALETIAQDPAEHLVALPRGVAELLRQSQ